MTACKRYPCDSAYRQRAHRREEDGSVMHRVSVGGSEGQGWWVDVVAWDWAPDEADDEGTVWTPRLRITQTHGSLVVEPQEASDLAAAMHRAAIKSVQWNQHETERLLASLPG